MLKYNLLVTKVSELIFIGMLCYTTISILELLIIHG